MVTRQVLFPAILLSLYLLAIYSFQLLPTPPSPDVTPSHLILWMSLVVLAVYSVNQFAIWLISELVIRPGHLKIPKFVLNLFGGLFLAIVFLFVLSFVFGQELSGILLTSTVASAIIGFSIQDTLSNLFAGIALQIESPFAIDDWVEIGGHEGQVLSQNWRTLMLLTRENHRVSLTNQFVASDKIINYSRPSQRQIQVLYINLDYSHPPNLVKEIMIDFLNSVEECEYDPQNPPFVAGFAEYSIRYGLRFWIKDYGDIIKIQDLVYSRLWYIFKREGIKIPYPIAFEYQMELPQAVAEEASKPEFDIPALLAGFDLLTELKESQIEQLAKSARMNFFAKGETLVQEGDEGDSLFLVTKGVAEVSVKGDHNQDIYVQHKYKDDFFGEMSLLTGEPRSATIKAVTDVNAIVLRKDGFTGVLMQDPSILTLLLDGIDEQKSNIETQRSGQKAPSASQNKSAREILVNRVWTYLGLNNK